MNETRELIPSGGFQQREGSIEIGSDYGGGRVNTAVHMRLGGEMNDGVRRLAREQRVNRGFVADVRFHEFVIRMSGDGLEIFGITRVSKRVKIDDSFRPSLGQRHSNERRANKSSPSRNNDLHLCCSSQS